MEIFGGAVKYYGYTNLTQEQLFCGNAKLQGTEFYIKRYCNNNFNDILHSFVILFELMVVNQWHDILWSHDNFICQTDVSISGSFSELWSKFWWICWYFALSCHVFILGQSRNSKILLTLDLNCGWYVTLYRRLFQTNSCRHLWCLKAWETCSLSEFHSNIKGNIKDITGITLFNLL